MDDRSRETGPGGRLPELESRLRALRVECEARGETFYPGPSQLQLAAFPPKERWDDWIELDSKAWPRRLERHHRLIPTTCFNCESACGLLAYVDAETQQVRKFEGNPLSPGSRGRNCAKGPATLNQIQDPDRILWPLRRAGGRGEGRWERISWEEALDTVAARIRRALSEGRNNEIMYHVGRPGEDGFTERMLAAWNVDGHNSHTNICSSGGRAGFQFWMGFDRPSPDFARAEVILLISAHLESGHYFNPHAQRIVEARARGARLIVLDVRLSNTASQADYWLSPYPGSEAAILLAIAAHLIAERRIDQDFIRRWWNWEEYLRECRSDLPVTFESFLIALDQLYRDYSFDFAARESGISAERLREVAEVIAGAGHRLAAHIWRSAAAGNLGGWQISRALVLLPALLGAIATEGGTYPNTWNKFVPRPIHEPPHPTSWNALTYPLEYPLGQNEMSFLLPHFLKEGRGRIDTYFSRVYNPVWTNPDGFSWIGMLSDPEQVGLHVALTPTWSETAYLADLILPMGHASERHDLFSYEQYDGQWIGFRQPVLREARRRAGEPVSDTRSVNPGEVWEENEFWIELSWRIDPDGSLGIRRWFESKVQPGQKLSVDEYYAYIFEHSVPGLPEAAAAAGLSPLDYMRRYGSFEICRDVGPLHERPLDPEDLEGAVVAPDGRIYSPAARRPSPNAAPLPAPGPDAAGRRAVGVQVDGRACLGFPTPSGRLEFYSKTLAEWGWPEQAVPGYLRSHVHPDKLKPGEMPLIPTFRVPVQIHTRSANAKWLDEIAHTNPLWIHPSDAARLGLRTGSLVRVETPIGHMVLKAWVTEGIRPGVVACSHHMGRWRPAGETGGSNALMATVERSQEGPLHRLSRLAGAGRRPSGSGGAPVWWSDVGVHQNLIFPVHPDPISGMHCWHQAVSVRAADPGDRYGDIAVDTERAHQIYLEWLALTRPATPQSPGGLRRPYWLLRPLRPSRDAYRVS